MACTEMFNELQIFCDDGLSPAVVIFDLSAAFDTVDHGILLRKYQYSGVSGKALKLMESYLINRQQFVQVGEHRAEKEKSK